MPRLKNKRIYQLFSLMIAGLLIVTLTSLFIIYKTVYNEKKSLLHEVCMNQKGIIQSIYDESKNSNTVLDVLVHQRKISEGLGTTGEFTIGFRRNDSIIYLIKSRQNAEFMQSTLPFNSDRGKPMQYALANHSDFVQGLDYRGNMVLSYVTYIPELKWGLVTKMDIAEVRFPIYKTGFVALVSSIFFILMATILFMRISRSVVRKITDSEENYHLLFEYSAIPIWKEDFSEVKKYVDHLKRSGVTDLKTYFSDHENEINNIMSLIKVVEINQQSVEFFKAESKEQLMEKRHNLYTVSFLEVCKEGIALMADGVLEFVREIQLKILTGETKFLILHLRVVKGYESTLSNVLISFIDISELKKAEQQTEALLTTVQIEKERLETLIYNIPDEVWFADTDKIFTLMNPYARNEFGLRDDNNIGIEELASNLEVFRPDGSLRPMEEAPPLLALKGEVVKNQEEIIRNPISGELRIRQVNASPVKDTSGNIIGSISIVRDITERKKAEEAIIASEREFRILTESMPQIVWTTTADGLNTYFNHQWVDYTGMTLEESSGTGWNKPFHPDDQMLAWDAWQNAVQYRAPYLLQCRLRRADGAYRWWLIHGVPVLDQNDTITKWYGTCTDIDDMKRAGDIVFQNEQLLRSIIENVSSGVALIDETGKFEVYNPVFLKLFGLSADSTIKNVNDQDWSQWQVFDENKNLLHVDDHPVRKAAMTGKLVKNQLVAMILPSGSDYIWMMISAEPLHKEDGTIDKIICTYHDITERKKYEQELASKNLELEKSNATKDRFFSIIAHDMKNPFISLLGTSELLYENAQKYDKQKIVELAKNLNDSAKNGYDTLLNLLGWAGSQAGNLIFKPEPINLKSLIHRNLANLTETACSKQIKLSFSIDDSTELFADFNMLNAILRNLINNAIKFTPRGGEILVGTKSDKHSIVVFIKDNGVGIDTSDLKDMFRSDVNRSRPGTEYESGTGLGLLLCKEFVEKHGGEIWVESEVHKGSTFYFSLPSHENT